DRRPRRPEPPVDIRDRLVRRYAEAVALAESGEASELTTRAVELLRRGLRPIDMPERLGVSRATVYQSLADPTRRKVRARQGSYGGTCRDCGRRTSGSNGRGNAPERCTSCANAKLSAEAKARAVEAKARIIEAIREWVRRYGSPPSVFDWAPAPSNLA